MAQYTEDQLYQLTNAELREICQELDLTGYSTLNKGELVDSILDAQEEGGEVDSTKEASAPEDLAPSEERLIDDYVADVRMAHKAGVKIAQVDTSDEKIEAGVLAKLTADERKRVCFGGGYHVPSIG